MMQSRRKRSQIFVHAFIVAVCVVQLSTHVVTAKASIKGQYNNNYRTNDAYTIISRSNRKVINYNQRKQQQQQQQIQQRTTKRFKSTYPTMDNYHENSIIVRNLKKEKSKKHKKGGGPKKSYEEIFVNPDLCIVRDSIIIQERSYVAGNDNNYNKHGRQLVDVSFTTKKKTNDYQLHSIQQQQLQRITTTVDRNDYEQVSSSIDISSNDGNEQSTNNNVRNLQDEMTFGPPPEWTMPYPYCDEAIVTPPTSPVSAPVPVPVLVPPPPTATVGDGAIIPPPVPTVPVPTNGEFPTADMQPPVPTVQFPTTSDIQPPVPTVQFPTTSADTPVPDVSVPLPTVLSPAGEAPTTSNNIPPPVPTTPVADISPMGQLSPVGGNVTPPVQDTPSAPTAAIAPPTTSGDRETPTVVQNSPSAPTNDMATPTISPISDSTDDIVSVIPFTPTASPTTIDGDSSGDGGIPFMPTISPTPTSSAVPDSFIDCDGVASGTAAVNGYFYEEFLITMTVTDDSINTNITAATTELEQHLQKYVATAMAGCRDLQDSPIPPPAVLQQANTTLRNVVFYVNNNTQKFSSVSTKQGTNSTATIITTLAEVYYTTGPGVNDSAVSETTRGLQQFLYDSVAEQCSDFPNMTDVDCSSIAVSLLSRQSGEDDGVVISSGSGGSSTGNSTTVVAVSQRSRTVGAGGISGIIIAGLICATLLAFFIVKRKRKSDEASSLQHLKLVDDEDPKERSMYMEDMEIATNSVFSESPPRLNAPRNYNNNSADSGDDSNDLRVMVVNETEDDDSFPSGNWEITTSYAPSVLQSNNKARALRKSQTLSNTKQDVHQCNSATCTICVERRRLDVIGGNDDILVSPEEVSMTSSYERTPWKEATEVQFISSTLGKSSSSQQKIKAPKSPKRRNVLPTSKQDDQREYYADDTVDL